MFSAIRRFNARSRHGASRCASFILIYNFPLLLFFHIHRSLPVPIRGYNLTSLASFVPPLILMPKWKIR